MILRKLLSTASVLALLAGPISVFADETGGAMAGGAADSWTQGSALGGIKNGTLATVAVAGGVGLGFGISELADDDDSSSSTTTTTTTTTTN